MWTRVSKTQRRTTFTTIYSACADDHSMKVKSLDSRVKSQAQKFALRIGTGSGLSTLDPRLARRAMTLIELLVVIIILTTVVAAAIPILSPANDNRRIREAGRSLNTFITGAQ